MKLMLNERWRREICPFCKDGFEQGDSHICQNCSTMMHSECFQENGGCAVLGCDTKTKDWPRCSQCTEQLSQLSAVVCILCGYDQEKKRYIDGVPRSRSETRRQEERVTLENPDAINWDLPGADRENSEPANQHLPLLVFLNLFSWLGVALFGVASFLILISSLPLRELQIPILCLAISMAVARFTSAVLSNKS